MFATSTLSTEPVISESLPQHERAQAAADQFERIFVQQMVQAMRSSSLDGEEGGMFGSGPGAGTFEDWFDSHLSRHLSDTGGVGLGEMLMRNWQDQGVVKAPGEIDQGSAARDEQRTGGSLDVHA